MKGTFLFACLFALLTSKSYFVSAAPSELGQEEEPTVFLPFCPEGTVNCPEKINRCLDYLDKNKEREKKFKRHMGQCIKEYGYTGELSPTEISNVQICAFQKLGYIVNCELDREVMKMDLEPYISEAPAAVKTSVFHAIDTCPSVLDDMNAHIICLVRSCVSAL